MDRYDSAFYKQTLKYEITPISKECYIPNILKHFKKRDQSFEEDVIDLIWDFTFGNTGDLEKIFFYLWNLFPKAGTISPEMTEAALEGIMQSEIKGYLQIIQGLTEPQLKVAVDISQSDPRTPYRLKLSKRAKKGMKRNGPIETLLKKGLVVENAEACVQMGDPFFKLFLRRFYAKTL